MNKGNDIGPGMARISLTIPNKTKRELQQLADNCGLSLNAYIGALMQDAVDNKPVVILRPEVIRETRPGYGTKQPTKKYE